MEKKKNRNLTLMLHFLDGCKGFFALALVSATAMSLADMLVPQIVRMAIDNCIGKSSTSASALMEWLAERLGGFDYLGQHLYVLAIVIVIIAFVRAVFTYLFRVGNTMGSELMVKNMRDELFAKIMHLPYGWHMENKTGDIIQRCTSDIDTIRSFAADKLSGLLRIVIMLVLSIVFMFSMSPLLTLIAIIPVPIIVIYSAKFHQKLMPGFMECDENEGILSDIAQENFTGVRVVRAFGREEKEREKFEKHNEYYTGLWVNMARTMAVFWSNNDVLSGLQIMLVVVFGAVFCINDSMLPGEYVAFISYNAMLSWPIRELGRMIIDMSKTGVSIERIKYICDAEPEKDAENTLCPDMSGDIVFDHVSFSYDSSAEILKDVNFSIKGGTTLGILGSTGSGKSTLMLLLDRLYELPEGCGTISIGGVDIRQVSAKYLRENIGMVLQEPFLFSGSIAENLSVARDGMSMEEIREAAKSASLDETVMDFSKGYETFVGERGVTLSGGQKQRAAIARALTLHAPIMIFDDSLSAVDTQTDEKIRKALEKEFGNATIILISHRITTLSKADRIIVLDKGRIVEEGTHESLKSAGGFYQQIYDIQSGKEEQYE